MICEQCKEEGKKSTVTPGASSVTVLVPNNYYDEAGNFHQHDGNTTTTPYRCSNGHKWSDKKQSTCWCGWPQKEAPKATSKPGEYAEKASPDNELLKASSGNFALSESSPDKGIAIAVPIMTCPSCQLEIVYHSVGVVSTIDGETFCPRCLGSYLRSRVPIMKPGNKTEG